MASFNTTFDSPAGAAPVVNTPAPAPAKGQSVAAVAEPEVVEGNEPEVGASEGADDQTTTEGEGADGAEGADEGGDDNAIDETELATLAKDEKLDLKKPEDRDLAERLLRREMKLRQELESGAGDPILTDFEKELYGDTEGSTEGDGTTPPAQQAQQPQQAQQTFDLWSSLNDAGKSWKSWDDANIAELEEFGRIAEDVEAKRKPDMARLSAIRQAQSRRALLEQMPFLHTVMQRTVQNMLQQTLGSVLPQVNELSESRNRDQARDSAIMDLERVPEFKGIRNLLKPGEGTVKFKDPATGQTAEVDNTPMNRILVSNPEILRIHVPHKDPKTSMRLTNIERYRAAMRIYNGSSSKTTKNLLKTAEVIAGKKQADRARQGLNGGSGVQRGGSAPAPVVNTNPSNWQQLFKS